MTERTARTRVRIKGTRLYLSAEPAFDAASTGRRVAGWRPSAGGINSLVVGAGTSLRNAARDLGRKDPWAENGREAYVANLIGTGIKPMSRAADEAFRAAVQELWLDWTDEADVEGVLDFYGQQAQVARALKETGECFIRKLRQPTTMGLTVPLQLQVIEADHVPLEHNQLLDDGGKIIAGVEFDASGRRAAYWMYRNHPGELLSGIGGSMLERVPADEIIHVFKPIRPGQVRGYPGLASVILRMRDMMEYEDAEIVRKKFAAMITAFVTSPEAGAPGLLNATTEGDPGVGVAVLEPGTTQVLKPGEDVKFSEAADLGGSYEPFMHFNLLAIAAGMGVTYEQLTGDLSGVNFSSIRAGLNEFQRRIEMDQEQTVAFQMCRPIWRDWMKEAVLVGALRAPGFADNPRPYLKVRWVAPGWRYVNPVQEESAIRSAIRNGTRSRRQAVNALGFDIEQIDQEIAEDNARADRLGLVLDTDPRKTSNAGITQARPSGTGLPSPDLPDEEEEERSPRRRDGNSTRTRRLRRAAARNGGK